MQADTSGIKFGPFWLTPGVSRINAASYFSTAFLFVTLTTFLGFIQPFLLSEVLQVPADQQGAVTGRLSAFHEGIALLVMGLIGALSDRTGRRIICVVGLLIWAIGLALYPLAGSLLQLLGFRFVIAIGVAIASVAVIATMQDYPQDVTRGKWSGTNSFITSFAILLVSLVLARLPGIFQAEGFTSVQAGRLTFWVGASVAVLAALVVRFGWYGGRFARAEETRSAFAGFLEGLRQARRNPGLALAYTVAFAARGDLIVIGSFYSLWFMRAGADQGISAGAAIVRAGITMLALQIAVWIWAPVFGWILDRVNRIGGTAIAMGLAAIGYFTIGQVSDPFNIAIAMAATFVLGIGEISAVIAGNSLLGWEAPSRIRGAAAGMFNVVGTFGILFATLVGGEVFDLIGYTAPFTMMAIVNGVVAVVALMIYVKLRNSAPADEN